MKNLCATSTYTVKAKTANGTIVKADSISLNPMHEGSEILDLIVRDSTGNIVYTEKIALKSFITESLINKLEASVEVYPNPVKDILYIGYSGHPKYNPFVTHSLKILITIGMAKKNQVNILYIILHIIYLTS